ncbi:MAG: hypothetical protein KAI66_11490 [Lentisphaeria bacterium]|nr:hypothetical protein [Lentisphaeria bacterium]
MRRASSVLSLLAAFAVGHGCVRAPRQPEPAPMAGPLRVRVGICEASGRNRISRFGIGFNTVTTGSFYHGCIDDIRIHERVLSAAEFGPLSPGGVASR